MKVTFLFMVTAFVGSLFVFATPPKNANNRKSTFVDAQLRDGRYTPWRNENERIGYYAGEVTTIQNGAFHYTYFTDSIVENQIDTDFEGPVKVFVDHIYLDHPGVAYPYRFTGLLDGDYVMITWEGLQEWKTFGKIQPHHILYLDAK